MQHLRVGFAIWCLLNPCLLFANPREMEVVQPVENPSGIVLVSDGFGSQVITPGGQAQAVRVGDGEVLTDFVEVATGWVGAGFVNDGERSRLVFYSDGAGGVEGLPAPNPQSESKLGSFHPTLLVRNQGFEGVAWLEGDDLTSLAVRAALWSGLEWGDPEKVAAPGPGSQTGLTGAILQDGSWLLAWSRYDGIDDEIYWSLRQGEAWTEPERVDSGNEVPDVAPHMVATKNGALLAWNRYDGNEYRVVVAKFLGDSWQTPHYAAPPGSLAPRFNRRKDTIFLTYREAWPRAWSILEMTEQGRTLRRARVDEATKVRPIVSGQSRVGIRLEWLDSGPPRSVVWENVP